MYPGPSNPNYHRTPFLQTAPYPAGVGGPPFSDPFNRPPFPSQYRGGPPGHPPTFRGPAAESYSGGASRDSFYEVAPPKQFQHSQPPQGWAAQQTDLQSLEVRKKAEEFLRILEAKDKLELSGQSGEKCARRQSQDEESGSHSAEKHSNMRSKSRARSRGRSKSRHRSRSRSRGKSRARSRSQGRSRAKSRAKSRARSRSRSRSRSRGKSRTRAKSRARSHDRAEARSKSQPRVHSGKDSQWTAKDPSGINSSSSSRTSQADSAGPDLFQGLKQVLQSKELEKHLSVVKGALLWNQIPNEARETRESQPAVGSYCGLPDLAQNLYDPEMPTGSSQTGLLPHERVGEGANSFPRILFWNDPSQQPEVKPMFPNIEDEEEFLYGEEEGRAKPQAVTVPLAQSRPLQSPVDSISSSAQSPYLTKSLLSQTSRHQELKVQATASKQPTDSSMVAPEDCEKVKNMLKTIGLNLSMTDVSKMAARLKQKQVEQSGTSPAAGLSLLKPALEALQVLSKAPKSDDSRSNRSGSSHSHKDSDYKEKQSEEKERREKQIQMKRKEYLVKELEELLKQEGSGDLIPVIGFFCQQCETFFGDLNSAEGHVASHRRSEAQKKASLDQHDRHKDKKHGENQQKPHQPDRRDRLPVQDKRSAASRIYQDFRERSPERKRARDEKSPHSTSSHGTEHSKAKSAESERPESKEESKDKSEAAVSPKSEKKKKKKEKKTKKKKEKKKEKKKKKEKEAVK
ncbi:uncharacterized protein [Salminus brasiliensis]|uniref:uncharacterized protein isoform X2 n=1 Tax=Salminus brasiliensis TaxID=930266 RepID=UPI003B833181